MSFTEQVRTELCRLPLSKPCCRLAELYGAILYASELGHQKIRLTTMQQPVAQRLQLLLRGAAQLEVQPILRGKHYQLVIDEPEQLSRLFSLLGYDTGPQLTYHLNRNIVEQDCCLQSLLRGAFLMAGSVAEPSKKSHLELKTMHCSLAGEMASVMLDLGLSPKSTERAGARLLYLKDTVGIEDFLAAIGATNAAMELMQGKVEKTLRNKINRQVNCEAANLQKAAGAAMQQVHTIEQYLAERGEGAFPEALRETVQLRLRYPEDSLIELAARFSPPISKSGLSHRLKKIIKLATEEKEQ